MWRVYDMTAENDARWGAPRTLPRCHGHPSPCSAHDPSAPLEYFDGGTCHDLDEFDQADDPDRMPLNYDIISGCHRCYLKEIGRASEVVYTCLHGAKLTAPF